MERNTLDQEACRVHFDFSHCGCLSGQWEASVEIYTENIYVHIARVNGIMSVKHVFLGGGGKAG